MQKVVSIATAFIIFAFIFAIPARADCPEPEEEVYSPGHFPLAQQPLEPLCCCYDNDIFVKEYDEQLLEEDRCCWGYAAGCELWWISIDRGARAVVRDGPMNEWDGGSPVYTEVDAWTIDIWCFCSSVGTRCENLLTEGTLFDYSCISCP